MVFNLLNCVSKPTRSVESIGYIDSQLVHLRSGSVSMNHLYSGLTQQDLDLEQSPSNICQTSSTACYNVQ